MAFWLDLALETGRSSTLSRAGAAVGIILDIDMPVMDGLACLKAIRQNKSYDDASVVMCTTHNSMEKVTEALQAGADEYIMKPFDEEIMRSKLEAVGLL